VLVGSSAAAKAETIASKIGIQLSVGDDGSFEITTKAPAWTFAGNVGSPVADLTARSGRDRAGDYRELQFKFRTPAGAPRAGAIRLYQRHPAALFQVTFLSAGERAEPFPSIASYPRDLHHLGYTGVFGGFSFEQLGTDGPWAFFDDHANTFILSPASHYMDAALSLGPREELRSAMSPGLDAIPPGFVATTALVIAPGINHAFEAWGRLLTDLAGKPRPANDADFSLRYLGYWTDHGGSYYYRFEDALGYAGTLIKVRDEFAAMGIRLGYLQLDSWFYPKGHDGDWWRADPVGGGTYRYEASSELFPDGLAAFQRQLGLPLIAHNRWIDRDSPYRATYAVSGNVLIDPALWAQWMRYLHASGVRTYEQDWLSGPAEPGRELGAGELFMDAMATAARVEGIALQYCMPLPRHFLQGTRYPNLLTIRVSGDRFEKAHWRSFLFNGRLASALGEWPWTDVFMSTETTNLLLATLSASIVGVGDAIGTFDRANLLRAARADGVIVKPDDTITPLDRSYIEAANGRRSPIIATAHTRHARSTTTYVFAFAQTSAEQTATLSPSALGYAGPVYAYDVFNEHGTYLAPDAAATIAAPETGAYWIVVPVGPSGIGFLGDAEKFVSNGRNRVARIDDGGTLTARIVFAAGENRIRLRGFSGAQPTVSAARARVENLRHDPQTGLFTFDLVAKPGASPVVTLRAAAARRS